MDFLYTIVTLEKSGVYYSVIVNTRNVEIANFTGDLISSLKFLKDLKLTDAIFYIPKGFHIKVGSYTHYIKALFNPNNLSLLPAIANEINMGPLGLARQIARTSLSRSIQEVPKTLPTFKFTWLDWFVAKLFPNLAN